MAAGAEEGNPNTGDKKAAKQQDKMATSLDERMASIREEKAKNTQRIRVMIFLSVCYSANTGGSGTLTGQFSQLFT